MARERGVSRIGRWTPPLCLRGGSGGGTTPPWFGNTARRLTLPAPSRGRDPPWAPPRGQPRGSPSWPASPRRPWWSACATPPRPKGRREKKKEKKAQNPRRQHNLSERHPPGGPASRPQPTRARCCATNSPVVAKSSARDASGAARAAARDPAPCGDDPAHPSVHCDPPRVHLLFERRARAHSRTWFWQALRCATRSSFGPMKKICIFGERRGVTRTQEGTLAAQDGLGTTAEEVSGWGPTASTRRRLRRRDLSEDRNARTATTRRTAPSVRERATIKSAPWGGER